MTELEQPSDVLLERDVIGACLLRPDAIASIDLGEHDFADQRHKSIWAALVSLQKAGERIDLVRVRSALLDGGKLAASGGEEYLTKLRYTMPPRELPTGRLRELARMRAMRRAAEQVVASCIQGAQDEAISRLADAHTSALSGAHKNRTENVMELCIELLAELSKPLDPSQLIHMGYETLTEQLGLVPLQTSIGVLATTNVGKSTFCLEMLTRMASQGVACGYMSVEDQKRRVRARVAGMMSNLSSQKILQHNLTRDEFAQLDHGFNEIDRIKDHLHVSILQGGTDSDVCAAMTDLAHRGCKVVVIDYLQKITSSEERKQDSKANRTADIATRITSHGQRLNLITVLVSQATRDKTRQNECPSKHDMKESGDLENMLDVVIGLWREFEDDYSPTWARLIKTKDGGVGKSWCMRRDAQTGRLEELAESENAPAPDTHGAWAKPSKKGYSR